MHGDTRATFMYNARECAGETSEEEAHTNAVLQAADVSFPIRFSSSPTHVHLRPLRA